MKQRMKCDGHILNSKEYEKGIILEKSAQILEKLEDLMNNHKVFKYIDIVYLLYNLMNVKYYKRKLYRNISFSDLMVYETY